MDKVTKLSIVIPSYNSAQYIEDCLNSIINQVDIDKSKIEVIFVDDGSTDHTSELISKFKNHKFIIPFYKENSGISLTRNYGVSQSSGEFILFLDSDDKLDCYGLKKIIDIIESMKVDVVLFSGEVFYDDELVNNTFKPQYDRPLTVSNKLITGNDFFIESVKENSFFVQPCMYAFRKELFLNNEFVPGILHEDNPFTVNLLLHKNNLIYCITDKIYLRRVRNNSVMTSGSTEKNAAGYLYSVNYIYKNYYNDNHNQERKLAVRKMLFKLIKCGSEIATKIGSNKYTSEFECVYNSLSPNFIERVRFKRPFYFKVLQKLLKIK